MKRSFLYSITLHSLLLLFLIKGELSGGSGNGGENKGGEKHQEGQIVEKQTLEVELQEMEDGISEEKPRQPKPETKFVDRDCGDHLWFGGVGLTIELIGGSITVHKVHPGYPAAKAGIVSGDELLNFEEIKGNPGETVVIRLLRNGKFMSVPIVRERICLEEIRGDVE